MPDTLNLDASSSDSAFFNLSKADLNPIKFLRTSSFGKNFDVVLNRNPLQTQVEIDGLGDRIFYVQGDKRLRFFTKSPISDSIPLKISLKDSVGFSKDSLVWAKFPPSERKTEKLTIKVNSGKSFYQKLSMELNFNKPITQIRLDSLAIKADSILIPIRKEMLSFADSSKRDLLRINLFLPDSIETDLISLIAADSTFQDIEGEVNEKPIQANYRKLKRKNLADGISGEIRGADGKLVVQLINGKKEIEYELKLDNESKFSFSLLDPGTYSLRVIEDRNGNGIWDPSNYQMRKSAERVFYYEGEEQTRDLIVRGGWTVEDLVIRANNPSGLRKTEKKSVDNP